VGGRGEGELGGGGAGAVVADADEFDAALFEFHDDAVRAGVDGVLDEFLDDAGGAFHHLAGGDTIDEMFGKAAY